MKYLILSDHPINDLRVSKSQKYLPGKTLQIPKIIAKFFWVPGYGFLIYLLTFLYKFDCLYAHDLFLSRAATMRNKPVYADLHENFYDCFHHSKFRLKIVGWFFRDARIYKMIEKVKDKATVITCTRPQADLYGTRFFYPNVGSGEIDLYKKHKRDSIIFVGRNRGLENVNWKEVPRNHLIIISDNTGFDVRATYLKLSDPRVKHIYRTSTYGLLPNPANPHTRIASPNKLFTYMKNGLAVICADHMEEVVRIIDKYDCGYHAPTIEEAINKALTSDPIQKCNNARMAVFEEYNERKLVRPVFAAIKIKCVSLHS